MQLPRPNNYLRKNLRLLAVAPTRVALCSFLLLSLVYGLASNAAAEQLLSPRLRRPKALQLSRDEKFIFIANRRSGSLSIVDLTLKKTVAEFDVGKQLSDLTATPKGDLLLAVDESAHELLLIEAQQSTAGDWNVTVKQRLKVSPYPVSISLTRDGQSCAVSSLWSRRISIIDLPTQQQKEARLTRVINLPFAPRKLLNLDNQKVLLAADSFTGRLAVIDPSSGEIKRVRTFPGHNIRGLDVSADGKMLLVAHQMLNELAHTVRNDVHWGLLMSNDLRWLNLDGVLKGSKDLYAGAHMHPLGEAGSATGDPAGIAVAKDGLVVATLGGVGEIAMGYENDFSLYRTKVGRRPTDIVISSDSKWAYVANTFGDSISVIDLRERTESHRISLGPQTALTIIDRGEFLFFDATLSHDSWMSCQSCHTDGHTNGMLNDNFSDKSFGAPKRVLSLLGRNGTSPFGWNGSVEKIGDQIRKTLIHTMQKDNPPTDKQIEALSAYIQTLKPPPPVDLARGLRDPQAVARGHDVFQSQKCNRCHKSPTYTTPKSYDVGLVDKIGNTQFNPPSLLGVGQRGPYFHDGRAVALEDVFNVHGHQLNGELSEKQMQDLLAFLRSL